MSDAGAGPKALPTRCMLGARSALFALLGHEDRRYSHVSGNLKTRPRAPPRLGSSMQQADGAVFLGNGTATIHAPKTSALCINECSPTLEQRCNAAAFGHISRELCPLLSLAIISKCKHANANLDCIKSRVTTHGVELLLRLGFERLCPPNYSKSSHCKNCLVQPTHMAYSTWTTGAR